MLLVAVVVYYFLQKKKQRRLNSNIYQKLSRPNKQIINIVFETQKSTTSPLHALATTYQNRTGEPIDKKKLLHILSEAEKTGIIKSDIANNIDEPTNIWNAQTTSRKTSTQINYKLIR